MDLSTATQEQISDYKNNWRTRGYLVSVASNMDVKGKDWCRHKLERWSWSMEAFSDSNHHKFLFEHESAANRFAKDFDSTVEKMVDRQEA